MQAHIENPVNQTLLMKFGGTSVGTSQAVKQVIGIVRDSRVHWQNVLVVTSALSGVTNLLLNSAAAAAAGDRGPYHSAVEDLRHRHLEMVRDLVEDSLAVLAVTEEIHRLLAEFAALCEAITVLGEATPRALDTVAALGERLSVRVLTSALKSAGIPAETVEATQLIYADNHYQAAHPDFELTRTRSNATLRPILQRRQVPVITGFIAATSDGSIVTLGRGGSDYSAAILGACLPADEVWIWTDVDGVMSADPRLVREACTIPALTFKEVGELAYFGAKVLHPKSIRPVIEAGIGLRVRNTFNPTHPGTQIFPDPPRNGTAAESMAPEGVIKAVTAISGLSLITLEGRGMLGVPGVAARTFEAVAATGTSVPLISQASSEQSICFAVPKNTESLVLTALEEIFADEIRKRDIDRIWASEEVVILTVVGAGMRHTPGVAGRIFTALGEQQVNVIAIAQGSSEVSVSLVVDARHARAGLIALHELVQSCHQ